MEVAEETTVPEVEVVEVVGPSGGEVAAGSPRPKLVPKQRRSSARIAAAPRAVSTAPSLRSLRKRK